MKKLVFGAAMALALTMGSCGGSASSQADGDTLLTKGQADTLVISFAEMAGGQIGERFNAAMMADSTLSKEQFIKGLQYALAGDTTTSYSYGMNIGLNLVNQIKYLESMGVKVDRDKLISTFKAAFMQDSIDTEAVTGAQMTYNGLFGLLRENKVKQEQAIKAASPEAVANVQAGKAYLDSVRSADADVKVADSGLGYKIIATGDTTKIDKTKRVTMRYTGSTVTGRVFDKQVSADNELRPMPVGMLVAGMQEGLSMLGKGGKAVFYIPGELAYGVDGQSRAEIGPNEMLVFEVEVVGVD